MLFKQRLLAIKTLGALVATLVGPLAHAQIIAVDDYYQVPQGTTVAADFLENDVGDNLEVVEIAIPYPRSFEWNWLDKGAFKVIPAADFVGVIKIIYQVRDANGEFAKATVTIEYLAPAEPPAELPVQQPPVTTSLADVLDKVAPIQALAQVSQQAALGHGQFISQFLRTQRSQADANLVYRAVTPLGGSAGDSGMQYGVFVNIDATRVDGKPLEQLAASSTNMQGLTAGVDVKVSEQWVLGTAMGASSSHLTSNHSSVDINFDELSFWMFSTYQAKQWQIVGLIGNSQSDISSNGQAQHEHFATKGNVDFGLLRAAYSYENVGWLLQPGLELRRQEQSIDGFADAATEDQIHYGAISDAHSIAAINVYGSYSYSASFGVLTPQLTLASEYGVASSNEPLSISVNGESLLLGRESLNDSHYLVADLGLSAVFKNGFSGYVNYHQVFEHRAYGVQSLQLGVRKEL